MSNDCQFDVLIGHWYDCRENGQPVSVDDLCRDCPEMRDQIAAAVANIERVEALDEAVQQSVEAAAPPAPASGVNTTQGRQDDREPTPIPGYRLEGELGRGGGGVVWRATAPGGIPVALKVINLKKIERETGQARGASIGELEIVRHVRHANLIAVHAAYFLRGGALCPDEDAASAEQLVFVMELANGSLKSRAAELPNERIPKGELLGYMAEVARALDFLHNQALTFGDKEGRYTQHLDIKPENLLLVGNSAVVADFGLARLLGHTVTAVHVGGTHGYVAPEVWRGLASKHSDQYALAVTYYHLLTATKLPLGNAWSPVLPNTQTHVITKALSENWKDRYPSCSDFVAALVAGAGPSANGGDSADPVTDYLNKFSAVDNDVFRLKKVEGRDQALLHQAAYAREGPNKPSASLTTGGIEFQLIPPATTVQKGQNHSYPAELSLDKPNYFYLSKRPVSQDDWQRHAAAAGAEVAFATSYSEVKVWLDAVRGKLQLPLRLPRPVEWQHAARLRLIDGSSELCVDEGGYPMIGTYKGQPDPFHCSKASARQRFDADLVWRVVLESSPDGNRDRELP